MFKNLFRKKASNDGTSVSNPINTSPSHSTTSESKLTAQKSKSILLDVFRYYKRMYTPKPEQYSAIKTTATKLILKPAGIVGLGLLCVMFVDQSYRSLAKEEEAPSIFKQKGRVQPRQVMFESEWLHEAITEDIPKQTPNKIREYLFKKKEEEQVPSEEIVKPESNFKKCYAKLDYYPHVANVDRSKDVIHHVHIEKYHPYANETNKAHGYWSTLIEYAIVNDDYDKTFSGSITDSTLALHILKEQQESFLSYLWRTLVTKKQFETWMETGHWIRKPWILSEFNMDLKEESETNVSSLKEYLANLKDDTLQPVILATLNSNQSIPSFQQENKNYYLYVSDEAFKEFTKPPTSPSHIRVKEKGARVGDVMFIVGTKHPESKTDISSLQFMTHKNQQEYIDDCKLQEKKYHAPMWLRSLIVTGSLGVAVASILLS